MEEEDIPGLLNAEDVKVETVNWDKVTNFEELKEVLSACITIFPDPEKPGYEILKKYI